MNGAPAETVVRAMKKVARCGQFDKGIVKAGGITNRRARLSFFVRSGLKGLRIICYAIAS